MRLNLRLRRLGRPREPWQRNLTIMLLVGAVTHTGFDLVNPFLPLYVMELGARDAVEIAQWSGLLLGISPFMTGFMGPFWGAVADRHGRKRIMMLSIAMFAVILTLTGTAQTLWQLLLFRAAVGLLGGFTNLAMVLATAGAPREQVGQAVGAMQTVNFVALAIIPPLGGMVRDQFGVRTNCLVGGLCCLLALILLAVLYRQPEAPRQARDARRPSTRESWRAVLALPGFVPSLAILFSASFVERGLFAVVPLFVTILMAGREGAGTIIGLIVGIGSLATALSSAVYGRLSTTRPLDRLLTGALLGGIATLALIAALPGVESLAVLRVLFALVAGGTITLAYTRAGREVPAARAATGYSLISSSSMLGGAVSPFLVGAIASLNLALVFVADVALYGLALGILLRARWRARQRGEDD